METFKKAIATLNESMCGFSCCGPEDGESIPKELEEVLVRMTDYTNEVANRSRAFSERAELSEEGESALAPVLPKKGSLFEGGAASTHEPKKILKKNHAERRPLAKAVQSTQCLTSGSPSNRDGFPVVAFSLSSGQGANALRNVPKQRTGFWNRAMEQLRFLDPACGLGRGGGEEASGRVVLLSRKELQQITKSLLASPSDNFETGIASCTEKYGISELDLLTQVSGFLEECLAHPHVSAKKHPDSEDMCAALKQDANDKPQEGEFPTVVNEQNVQSESEEDRKTRGFCSANRSAANSHGTIM